MGVDHGPDFTHAPILPNTSACESDSRRPMTVPAADSPLKQILTTRWGLVQLNST